LEARSSSTKWQLTREGNYHHLLDDEDLAEGKLLSAAEMREMPSRAL